MNKDVPPPSATPAAAPPALAAPVIVPPKIKSITLCDFRGFAGPAPVTIHLDRKNILIYGENGAGKSSVFHALDAFFAVPSRTTDRRSRQRLLQEYTNKFSVKPKAKCEVVRDYWDANGIRQSAGSTIEVERLQAQTAIDDGALRVLEDSPTAYVSVEFDGLLPIVNWNAERHPIDTISTAEKADERVVKAAYGKAILDYRALLDTNYSNGLNRINLFDVIVNILLRDHEITVDGGNKQRVVDIWQRLKSYLGYGQLRDNDIRVINALTVNFNTGLEGALSRLLPVVNGLLKKLGWDDFAIQELKFTRVSYNRAKQREKRAFNGCEIFPTVLFNGHSPRLPQHFLNEARLSALALAIYFAGRKLVVQEPRADTPRIMVLDDVLIGLDQSNRLPVLDLLAEEFKSWQIVLLTHDRGWFEMARAYHRRGQADKYWRYCKIHSNDDPKQSPVVSDIGSSAAAHTLEEAKQFLKNGYTNAAGNYARIAMELALREFCETKKIEIAYTQMPDKTAASDLLTAAKQFSRNKCNGHYDSVFEAIEMYTTILLNSLSHGGVPTVTGHEVRGAINSVAALLFSTKVMPTGVKQFT